MTPSTDPTPVLDISVPKGAKTTTLIQMQTNSTVVPLPVGTKAKMQIRTRPDSTTVLAELTTENNGISLDLNLAQITIVLSTVVTAAFDFERAKYDLTLIYPDNEVERIVEGKIFVFPGITH